MVLRILFTQADVFQHVGPFPTLAIVAVFEVLSEVIGTVEFLCLVALSKLVDVGEMVDPAIPVRLR